MKLSQKQIADFRNIVYDFFKINKRNFPWRETEDPYCILVSEIMLQQTQTERVIAKYRDFINAFPDINSLALAPYRDVLAAWKGLGYNRRAKWLHEIAKRIIEKQDSTVPKDILELEKLPGIGTATARSIVTFAYNTPTVFLETNIRTVFIHHFFKGSTGIDEKELLELASQVIDKENPRKWYSALMDYGHYLKKNVGNLNRKSTLYRRQSKFEDSDRQIRGKILEILLNKQSISTNEICKILQKDDQRVKRIVCEMKKEELISQNGNTLSL